MVALNMCTKMRATKFLIGDDSSNYTMTAVRIRTYPAGVLSKLTETGYVNSENGYDLIWKQRSHRK